MMHLKCASFAAGLLLLTFCLVASPALAQTGPQPASNNSITTGPVGPTGNSVGPNHPANPPQQAFDHAALGNFLRQRGYHAEDKTYTDGRHYYLTTINKDGWRFVVELSARPDHSAIDIRSWVGNPINSATATTDRLLNLLARSMDIGGKGFFTYRPSDHRLLLYDFSNDTQAAFGPYLDRVLNDVKNTYNTWSWAAQAPSS